MSLLIRGGTIVTAERHSGAISIAKADIRAVGR